MPGGNVCPSCTLPVRKAIRRGPIERSSLDISSNRCEVEDGFASKRYPKPLPLIRQTMSADDEPHPVTIGVTPHVTLWVPKTPLFDDLILITHASANS